MASAGHGSLSEQLFSENRMYFVFGVLLSTEFTRKFRVRDCLGESNVKDVSLKDECKMQLKIFTLG